MRRKRAAGLGLIEADRVEALHGTDDGIVQLGVVAREPLAEELDAFVLEAGDDAGPIEACGTVVAVGGIGQVEGVRAGLPRKSRLAEIRPRWPR